MQRDFEALTIFTDRQKCEGDIVARGMSGNGVKSTVFTDGANKPPAGYIHRTADVEASGTSVRTPLFEEVNAVEQVA